MQSTKLYQLSATALLFMVALFSVSSSAFAARPDTSACNDLSGGAAGICRAAVSSGCAANGGESSRYCSQLASNFRKIAEEEPVWLAQAPAEEPAQEPASTTTTTDDRGLIVY